MSAQQFSARRSIVGWIWLIYGLICMGSTLVVPAGSYQSYSVSLIIGSICYFFWVVLSTIAKGLRIAKHYNEGILAMSLIFAVGALFFFSMATDKHSPPDIPEALAVKLGLAYIVWTAGWFLVDFVDFWNAPKTKEHPLRH